MQKGQEVFFKYGLTERGTFWGHGAYRGPDYSAEPLRRLSEVTRETIAVDKYGKSFAQLSPDDPLVASVEVRRVLKENRCEPASRTRLFTLGEVATFRRQATEWSDDFTQKGGAPGLPASYIKGPRSFKRRAPFLRGPPGLRRRTGQARTIPIPTIGLMSPW